MNCVDHLASLLAPAARIGGLAMVPARDIDAVIEALQAQIKSGGKSEMPADLQVDAVRRFWEAPHLQTLKEARLVAFGACLPVGPAGVCVLEDKARFDALLEGVDQWLHDARWYRRCYQGLVWSYFNYDVEASGVSTRTRENWERLREYLARRADRTVDRLANPDWVKAVIGNRHLFGQAPCQPHVARLLRGDRAEVDSIRQQLGIDESSWFMRQLVHAQVIAATGLEHDGFRALLPPLIEMLADTRMPRDQGLACLLERYAKVPQTPLHEGLRDAAASWWGSPWLASNALRWDGLADPVRGMVSQWLKADLIDQFFAASGEGGDPRRAAFWKRYVRSIQKIERAPGDSTLVMTMGRAVVVEFGDASVPLHGYDLRPSVSFDMARRARADLLLQHRDGLGGWRQWEQMFEVALKDRFDIRPGVVQSSDARSFVDLCDPASSAGVDLAEPLGAVGEQRWQSASAGEDVHWQTAEAASVPYSRPDLEVFARVHALRLDDDTARTGKLWVRADKADHRISRVLSRWGFEHVSGEGWRK